MPRTKKTWVEKLASARAKADQPKRVRCKKTGKWLVIPGVPEKEPPRCPPAGGTGRDSTGRAGRCQPAAEGPKARPEKALAVWPEMGLHIVRGPASRATVFLSAAARSASGRRWLVLSCVS